MAFFSPDDIYASAVNRASTLSVTSVTNATRAEFKAYDLDFSDSFTSNWASTNVFGRMDPIHIFKNTARQMSFNFNLLSANFNEALWNVEKISVLALAMYPIYKGLEWDANIFESAPLVRVKYSIVDGALGNESGDLGGETTSTPPTHITAADYRGPQRGKDYTGVNIVEDHGLPGFIASLNIKPMTAMGYHHIKRGKESNVVKIGTEFSPQTDPDKSDMFLEKIITSKGDDVIIPKGIQVSFEFTPVRRAPTRRRHREQGPSLTLRIWGMR